MAKNEIHSVKTEIVKAFMDLMIEKSYMDITVTDIINKAQVARASFYRNFNSINDVIEAVVDDMAEFMQDILPAISSTDERKWREFLFEYFYHFISFNKQKKNINFQNISVLLNRFENKLHLQLPNSSVETIRDKYIAFGKMGLINNIAKKWMDEGMKETPEEMINYIMSFITLF